MIVFCRTRRFLAARIARDCDRVRLLTPNAELADVPAYLDAICRVAAGDPGAGPIAALPPSERFGWLTAPSSTTVQTSEVHSGLSEDPQRTLDHLFERLVAGVITGRAGLRNVLVIV